MKNSKKKKTNHKMNDKEMGKVAGGMKVSAPDSRISPGKRPIIAASKALKPDMDLKGYGTSSARCVLAEDKKAKR